MITHSRPHRLGRHAQTNPYHSSISLHALSLCVPPSQTRHVHSAVTRRVCSAEYPPVYPSPAPSMYYYYSKKPHVYSKMTVRARGGLLLARGGGFVPRPGRALRRRIPKGSQRTPVLRRGPAIVLGVKNMSKVSCSRPRLRTRVLHRGLAIVLGVKNRSKVF